MRRVVGVVLVSVVLGVSCGGTTDNGGKNNAGGAGATTAGSAGTSKGGSGATGQGGTPSVGGKPNVAGTSTTNEAGQVSVGQAGWSQGGSSFGGAPGEWGGAGGEATTDSFAGASGASGIAGEAGQGGEGGISNGPLIACACTAEEACIKVTVKRDPSTTNQPWILWPTEADGTGTLTISAVSSTYTTQDKVTLPDVSLVAAEVTHGAALCVPPGSSDVRAFLDENSDQHPNAVTSSDYLDSCAPGAGQCFRCYSVSTTAGAEIDVTIALKNSCD